MKVFDDLFQNLNFWSNLKISRWRHKRWRYHYVKFIWAFSGYQRVKILQLRAQTRRQGKVWNPIIKQFKQSQTMASITLTNASSVDLFRAQQTWSGKNIKIPANDPKLNVFSKSKTFQFFKNFKIFLFIWNSFTVHLWLWITIFTHFHFQSLFDYDFTHFFFHFKIWYLEFLLKIMTKIEMD